MKKIALLLGPIVFLVAQFLWVEGSADNAQRVSLIRDNAAMWILSHQLFALSFALFSLWLTSICMHIRHISLMLWGAFFVGLALISDFAIAIEQIISVALVMNNPQFALTAINTWRADSNFGMLVLLPYFVGWLLGPALLAIGLQRSGHRAITAILIGLSGVLLAVNGLIGLKIVFVIAALALLLGTLSLARDGQMPQNGAAI